MQCIVADFTSVHFAVSAWNHVADGFTAAIGCAFPFGGNGQAIGFAAITGFGIAIITFFIAIDDAIAAVRGSGAIGHATAIVSQAADWFIIAVDQTRSAIGIQRTFVAFFVMV